MNTSVMKRYLTFMSEISDSDFMQSSSEVKKAATDTLTCQIQLLNFSRPNDELSYILDNLKKT